MTELAISAVASWLERPHKVRPTVPDKQQRVLRQRAHQQVMSRSHQQGQGVADEYRGLLRNPRMKLPDPNLAPPGLPPQFYPQMPNNPMMRPPSSHPGANFNSQQQMTPEQMEAMRNGPVNGQWRGGSQPKDTLRKVNGGRVESRMRPRGPTSLSRTTSFSLRSIERGNYERSDRPRLENLQRDLDIAKARRLPGTAISYTISEDDTISSRERLRRQLFVLECTRFTPAGSAHASSDTNPGNVSSLTGMPRGGVWSGHSDLDAPRTDEW